MIRGAIPKLLVWSVCAPLLVAQTPTLTTVAGATPEVVRGFSGDGGPAVGTALALANVQNECDPLRFEQTSHVFADPAGNIYLADSNNQRIRRISPQGTITTIAGTGERPAINARCEPTSAVGDGGPARDARLFNPSDVILHPSGSLIVADQQNNRIRQISPSGVITTIAGNGQHNLYAPGIPATASPMDWPSSLAVDASGAIYFAELHGNRVAKIGSDGRLATVAGTAFPGSAGDGSQATAAQLRKPAGIAVDRAGNVYIADTGNHRVRKVGSDGVITTVAGTGQAGYSGDGGLADSAMLNTPMDVKVDSRGQIYIADSGNHRVRRIDASGTITTVAGTGEPGRGSDFAAAMASSLNSPCAIAVDSKDNLYVVDWQNYLVRKITFGSEPALAPGGIVNGASFAPFPAAVAPGSIVAIFGLNLTASTVVTQEARWPTELAGIAVEVNGRPIPLYSISPAQLTGQLPWDLEPGTATAVIKTPAGASNAVAVTIAAAAPGIFQLGGTGRAAATNQDGVTVNSPDNPESRGNVISVYLTGLGAVSPDVEAGQPTPLDRLFRAMAAFSATIGGVDAEVQFLGLTPGSVGLAQANLRVPDAVAPGTEAPVVITIGGQASNAATISIR